jgi:hypothetical protein
VETLVGVDRGSRTDRRGFTGVTSYAVKADNDEPLWKLSEKLVGVRFPFEMNWIIIRHSVPCAQPSIVLRIDRERNIDHSLIENNS